MKKIQLVILLAAVTLGTASGGYAADFWFEDFTGGTQGLLPSGWMDDSTNSGFNARMVYTSTGGTYADLTVVAGTYGKALSPVQILNTTQYPKLEVKVTEVDAASALQIWIQEQTGTYRHWQVDHDQYITGPGTFLFDLPTVTGVSGSLTFSVETTVSGSTWSHARIDSIRIYSVDTPTNTPSATPTFTSTPTPSISPTPTNSATNTSSPTPSPTVNQSMTPTFTPTATPTLTVSATATPSPTFTSSRTATPTLTSSATASPTATPTAISSGFAYLEIFPTNGAPPPGWSDNTVDPSFHVNMAASGGSATLTITGANTYGKAQNTSNLSVNTTSYPYISFVVTSVAASSDFKFSVLTGVQTDLTATVNNAHLGTITQPGIYTYNYAALAGFAGVTNFKILLWVEGAGNPANALTEIFITNFIPTILTATPTKTPTSTPTPVATPSSNAFFDDFTNGQPPVLPPGWRDDTTDPGFNATLKRSGTTLAVMAKDNTATGFGKVLSPQLTTDFNAYQELEVGVSAMDPNTQFTLGIQDTAAGSPYYPLGGIITGPGVYTRNIPAANNALAGTHTYFVDLRIQNFTINSVTLDYVRVGVTSTPTITPTSTATPVPNSFRPALNLFVPKQGNLKLYYSVQAPSLFRVTVFNLSGQVVRSLVNESVKGTIGGVLEWDGKNDNGAAVASGVYLIRLETDVYRQNIRVAVVH